MSNHTKYTRVFYAARASHENLEAKYFMSCACFSLFILFQSGGVIIATN